SARPFVYMGPWITLVRLIDIIQRLAIRSILSPTPRPLNPTIWRPNVRRIRCFAIENLPTTPSEFPDSENHLANDFSTTRTCRASRREGEAACNCGVVHDYYIARGVAVIDRTVDHISVGIDPTTKPNRVTLNVPPNAGIIIAIPILV